MQTCGLPNTHRDPARPPSIHSIQLRITAENVQSNWSLSIGKITSFQLPTGNGIRTDTHLLGSRSATVAADFDSLLAKLIITASTWSAAVRKAQRALEDTRISGVTTNLAMLKAIVSHRDFLNCTCDTQWLERNQALLQQQQHTATHTSPHRGHNALASNMNAATMSPSTPLAAPNTLFRKGDAWSLVLSPATATATMTMTKTPQPPPHHIRLTHIHHNDFPTTFTAQLLVTSPTTLASPPITTSYNLRLASTSASATALTSQHRRADASNASHVAIPFPGTLVELLVQEGDVVGEGGVLCVVRQMKMELEVRAPRSGRVSWVMEVEEGEDVGEGVLAVILEGEGGAKL